MNCPECGHQPSIVYDTRQASTVVRRNRKCPECQTRWTTYEVSVDRFSQFRQALQDVRTVLDQAIVDLIGSAQPDVDYREKRKGHPHE